MLPEQFFTTCRNKITKQDYTTFIAAFIAGLLTHMRIFVQDIPNHDGMDSLFFDQNMITSGRWFLRVACGISSDYTLPWLIGVLCMLYLAVTAVILQRFFRVRHTYTAIAIAALLVVYPTLTSNFAYMFTADGYMLALLLAVLAVYFVEQSKYGFLFGAIALGFSMGIYQSYLSFAMILAVYAVCRIWFFGKEWKEKWNVTWRYVAMGILGAGVYYAMLQILLKVQHTNLSGYQGIGEGNTKPFLETLLFVYKDFVVHTIKGNIMMQKGILVLAMGCLLAAAAAVLCISLWRAGSLCMIWTYLCAAAAVVILPICFNVILLISPDVTYHSLMRYQWVLIPMIAIVIIDRLASSALIVQKQKKLYVCASWASVLTACMIVCSYAVICNIGYFNLEKKYEKTYAYCLRLLDRMEQTEGYYHGMPVVMIGVVGDHYLPSTDLTEGVTNSLIGIEGDYLFYTAQNYQRFMEYYFGVKIELVDLEAVPDYISTPEYIALEVFPKQNSMKVVDGVLYIRTENKGEFN